MTRERGLLALAIALLAALTAITVAQPPARELARLSAPASAAAGRTGERWAEAVRYVDLRLRRRGTLRVGLTGAHGGVLLSLVDAADRVREVRVEAGDTVGHFAAVTPGTYALRVLAAPPEPPARGETVSIRVTTGGRPWALFGLAALLVGLPPLVLLWRRRRTARDAEAATG